MSDQASAFILELNLVCTGITWGSLTSLTLNYQQELYSAKQFGNNIAGNPSLLKMVCVGFFGFFLSLDRNGKKKECLLGRTWYLNFLFEHVEMKKKTLQLNDEIHYT